MKWKGYPDFLEQNIDSTNLLKSFNKGFAAPKYKTTDIIQDLQLNPQKPVTGQEGETAEFHKSIAEANVITISVGANDVLAHIKIDPATGIATFDEKITAEIMQVGANYHALLTGTE